MKLIHFYVYAILCCSKLASSVPLCKESKKDLAPNVGHESQTVVSKKANSAFPTSIVPHVEVPVHNVLNTPNVPIHPIPPIFPGSVPQQPSLPPSNANSYLVVHPNGYVERINDLNSYVKKNPNCFLLDSQHTSNKAPIPPHVVNTLENAYKLHDSKKAPISPHIVNILENAKKLQNSWKATVPQMNIAMSPNKFIEKPAINIQTINTGIKPAQVFTPKLATVPQMNIGILPNKFIEKSATNVQTVNTGIEPAQVFTPQVATVPQTNNGIVPNKFIEKPAINVQTVNTGIKSAQVFTPQVATVPQMNIGILPNKFIEKPAINVQKVNTGIKPAQVFTPQVATVSPMNIGILPNKCIEKPAINVQSVKTVIKPPLVTTPQVALTNKKNIVPSIAKVSSNTKINKSGQWINQNVASVVNTPSNTNINGAVVLNSKPEIKTVRPCSAKLTQDYIVNKSVVMTQPKSTIKEIIVQKPIPKVEPCLEKQKMNYNLEKTVANTPPKQKETIVQKPILKMKIAEPCSEESKVNYIVEKTVHTTLIKPKQILVEKPIPKFEIVELRSEKPNAKYVVGKTAANIRSKPKEIVAKKPTLKVEIVKPCLGQPQVNGVVEKSTTNALSKPKEIVVEKAIQEVEIIKPCPENPKEDFIAEGKQKKNQIKINKVETSPEKDKRSTDDETTVQDAETESFDSSSTPTENSVEDEEENDFERINDDEDEIDTWYPEDEDIEKVTEPENSHNVIVVPSSVDEFYTEDIKPDDCHDDEEDQDNDATDHIKIDKAFVFKTKDSKIADILKRHKDDEHAPTYIFQLVSPVAVEREVIITIHPDGSKSEEIKETFCEDEA